MGISVDLHLVIFGLLGAMAILSLLVYAALRKHSALAWLSAAMVGGTIETLVLKNNGGSIAVVAAVSCLIPAVYYFITQAIRLALGLGRSPSRRLHAIIGLTAVSLALLALGIDGLVQTLPFQAAALIAIVDVMACLLRIADKSWIDRALGLAQGGMAVMFVMRIPFLPILFSGDTPFAGIEQPMLQWILLTISAVLAPASVLLIIAKIVGGVIASHRERADRDDLTGLLNRQAFERTALDRNHAGGFVIVCDIDHFKQVNDRYGHAVGDAVIRAFAEILHRSGDCAARIGGEEFALLLPGADMTTAIAEADRLRAAFHALRPAVLHEDHCLSASFGLAEIAPGQSLHTALLGADAALYRSKHEGRNRVSLPGLTTWSEPPATYAAA